MNQLKLIRNFNSVDLRFYSRCKINKSKSGELLKITNICKTSSLETINEEKHYDKLLKFEFDNLQQVFEFDLIFSLKKK
jgi:hypothetical protein